jgi:hypothetical protein
VRQQLDIVEARLREDLTGCGRDILGQDDTIRGQSRHLCGWEGAEYHVPGAWPRRQPFSIVKNKQRRRYTSSNIMTAID